MPSFSSTAKYERIPKYDIDNDDDNVEKIDKNNKTTRSGVIEQTAIVKRFLNQKNIFIYGLVFILLMVLFKSKENYTKKVENDLYLITNEKQNLQSQVDDLLAEKNIKEEKSKGKFSKNIEETNDSKEKLRKSKNKNLRLFDYYMPEEREHGINVNKKSKIIDKAKYKNEMDFDNDEALKFNKNKTSDFVDFIEPKKERQPHFINVGGMNMPALKKDFTSKYKENAKIPECEISIGGRHKMQGWYSLIGGVICGISKSLQEKKIFTVSLTRNMYESDRNVNAFNQVYEEVGNCRITNRTEPYHNAGWTCTRYKSRQYWHNIMRDFIVPNKNLTNQIDEFVKQNFGKHTLGVHIRATDRALDKANLKRHVHKVPSVRIIKAIERYLLANPETDKIFVASDNQAQLKDIKMKFPKLVVYQKAHRSAGSHRVHDGRDRHDKLIEVVLASRLLAKTDYLIKCYSEVSLASLVVNPNLQFDVLNYPDGYVFDKWRAKIQGFTKNRYVYMEDVNLSHVEFTHDKKVLD